MKPLKRPEFELSLVYRNRDVEKAAFYMAYALLFHAIECPVR